MNFYIGDPHLGHEAIIRLCNRPFADVDEMISNMRLSAIGTAE